MNNFLTSKGYVSGRPKDYPPEEYIEFVVELLVKNSSEGHCDGYREIAEGTWKWMKKNYKAK